MSSLADAQQTTGCSADKLIIAESEKLSCGKTCSSSNPFFSLYPKGTFIPHSWLSSHGENKFPHSLLRSSWGNLSSPFLLSHSWGKYNVPFVIHGKISFSPFVASPLKGKNPIPIPPNYGIKPFPVFWKT